MSTSGPAWVQAPKQADYGAPVYSSTVYSRLCTGSFAEPPPREGWASFFKAMRLCLMHSTVAPGSPAAEALHGTKPRNGWGICVQHVPTGRMYDLAQVTGQGTFGKVWQLTLRPEPTSTAHWLPKHLALKVFGTEPSWQNVAEISVVDRMELVDLLSGTNPTDRIPARALFSDDGLFVRAVIMPFATGSLSGVHHASIDDALTLLKATLVEVRAMHAAYKLWCVDLKGANILYDCYQNKVRVRAADYGGYAAEGDEALSTYCLPWDTMDGDVACEELCVYGLFVLFLSLCLSIGELDSMYAALHTSAIRDEEDEYNASIDEGISPPERRSIAFARRVFAMPWGTRALRVLRATTRYRHVPFNDYGGPALTLEALAEVLEEVEEGTDPGSDADSMD